MSSVRNIHIEQKTSLLSNIINNWIKENNHTVNNKNKIKFQNVSDWPKRSPFEFQNKNLIIPNNPTTKNNDSFNKNQKLKSINDNINLLISKNKDENSYESTPIKVSILSQNINTSTGSIMIKPINNESSKDNQVEPDNNNRRNEYEEKDIDYIFGYSKEERIEPLKLSLKTPNFNNYKQEPKLNSYNITSINIKKEDDINIEQDKPIEENAPNDIIEDDLEIKEEPKVLILPKAEKEIAYYKEKDLFDEEVKENDNEANISQDQMNILGDVNNKIFKSFNKKEKQKKFEIIHPYCDYKYHSIEAEESKNNIKAIFYKKFKRQENLFNMLRKQRIILNNIISKNNQIIKKKYKLSKCKSSIYEYELNKEKEKNEIKKKFIKSYSTNEYYNRENWEKRQDMYEKKKLYSIEVSLNEKRALEERRRARILKLMKYNEERQKLYEEEKKDEDDDEIDMDNEGEKKDKLPSIKKWKNNFKEYDKENIDNIFKKRIYTNSYNPLKKFKLKKNNEEKIIKTIIKHNPQFGELLNNHDIYNAKLNDIKSHIK